MTSEFYVSNIGGPVPRVLARFVTNERGLYIERLDRASGRWVSSTSVAGYGLGLDDFAESVSREHAAEVVSAWGYDVVLLDAPVVEPGPS